MMTKEEDHHLKSLELDIMSRPFLFLRTREVEFSKLDALYQSTKYELDSAIKEAVSKERQMTEEMEIERELHRRMLQRKEDELSIAEGSLRSMSDQLTSAREELRSNEKQMFALKRKLTNQERARNSRARSREQGKPKNVETKTNTKNKEFN